IVPPLAGADALTVRAGDSLVRLASADGSPLWTTHLADQAASGKFLLVHKDMLVTAVVRRPDRQDSVLGVTTSGEVAWRTDLPGILAPEGALLASDELWLAVTEAGGGTAHILHPATGTVLRRLTLPWGANAFATWSRGLLVRKPGRVRWAAGP